ncbi:MAG: beta-lactamase family protein [Oscillospiraceae bacterium]|nr:beta-lactamase family protein [Oscillospiraceae bacterium]
MDTSEDLAQFAIALTPEQGASGPLFHSRSTLDLMLSPSFSDQSVMIGTHHGFMSYDAVLPAVGHGGGTAGFTTDLAIIPSERFAVVVLTNTVGANEFTDKVLELLIGNSRDMVDAPPPGLPDAAHVAGNFVMLRRHECNVMEPLNFMLGTHLIVDALDENTIEVNFMGMSIIYQQVAPYIFRAISSDSPIARVAYEARIIMEDGEVVGMTMIGPFDLTVETFAQSIAALMINASMLGISLLFFLIMSVVVFIGFLRKRKEGLTAFTHLSNGLLLSGALIGLNYFLVLLRLGMAAPFISERMVIPHIWINYILVALAGILLIAALLISARHKVQAKRKVLFVLSIVFLAMLIFVLANWNFFIMM